MDIKESFATPLIGSLPFFRALRSPRVLIDDSLSLHSMCDAGIYDYDNCLPMMQYANFFKSALPAFRTQERLDSFVDSQPTLKKIRRARGLRAAAVHCLRAEISGGWRDENGLDGEDQDGIDAEEGEEDESVVSFSPSCRQLTELTSMSITHSPLPPLRLRPRPRRMARNEQLIRMQPSTRKRLSPLLLLLVPLLDLRSDLHSLLLPFPLRLRPRPRPRRMARNEQSKRTMLLVLP